MTIVISDLECSILCSLQIFAALKTVTMDFLREILAGRKKALVVNDITKIVVPRLPEFTVAKLYEMFAGDTDTIL
jgi:hypothetical protein